MFPSVIPLCGTDCSRVTHPSAARTAQSKLLTVPARLACVRHAASVRPEPGSNSYVQSFQSLRGANRSVTVFSRSESDCFSLFILLYIVVKDRSPLPRFRNPPAASLATTVIIIPAYPPFVNPFFLISFILFLPYYISIFCGFWKC